MGTRRAGRLAVYTEYQGESHPGTHMWTPWELEWGLGRGGGGGQVGVCGLGRAEKGLGGGRLLGPPRGLPGSSTLGVPSW